MFFEKMARLCHRCAVAALGSLLTFNCICPSASGQSPAYSYFGQQSDLSFGSSVAGGFDYNGDGLKDILVGGSSSNTNFPGKVKIITKNGLAILTLSGDTGFDRFGASVRGASDLNGDSLPDIVVGATGFASCTTPPATGGYVRAFSGSNGTVIYTIAGGVNTGFGQSIDIIGDLNGDGRPDIVVGAPRDRKQTSNLCSLSRGAVSVYSGLSGLQIGQALTGTSFGDNLGGAVGAVGDVNADGIDDFAAVAVGLNRYTRVYSGATRSELYTVPYGGNQGSSLARLADVNGDGRADFLLGTNLADDGTFRGTVRLISGLNGSVIYMVNGDTVKDELGTSVANVGDVNGDGVPDFVSGAPYAPGTSDLAPGYVRLYSGINGSIISTFRGNNFLDDNFGNSVAGVGDQDGNGKPDFVVGAPNDRKIFNNEGSAKLFFSPNGSLAPLDTGSMTLIQIPRPTGTPWNVSVP